VSAPGTSIEWYINGTSAGSTTITLDTWNYIVGTYDETTTTAQLYKNINTPVSKIHTIPTWPSEGTYIGDRSDGTRQFHGIIDEVRFSDIARSSSWIYTSYKNQNDPMNFSTIGTEETQPTIIGSPIFSNEVPLNNSLSIKITQATVNVTIIDPQDDPFDWTIEGLYVNDASGNDDVNGSKSATLITPLPFGTDIIWYVNATDGVNSTYEIYNFKTRSEYIPDPPFDFSANPVSSSKINLIWIKDTLADSTYVERNSVVSWDREEGTMIYNGSGTSFEDTGLSAGTLYYYQAWSWNNTDHVFSTSSVFDSATTFSEVFLWSVNLSVVGPSLLVDSVVFGEASDASDGQDSYDVPKPGMSPAPFLYSCFSTDLSIPYDVLWEEFKGYPGTFKKWNLTVLCSVSGQINISWNPVNLSGCEYGYVFLYDKNSDVYTDMLVNSYYVFTAASYVSTLFEIVCSVAPLEYDFEIPVFERWNMISVPFNESFVKSSVTVEYLDVNYTWSEAVTAGVILDFLYGWNGSIQGYESRGSFEPGESFWLYVYYNCSLWFSGEKNDDGFVSGLLVSWNFVGLPFDESVEKQNLTVFYGGSLYSWSDAVVAGLVLDFVYEWVPVSQSYVSVGVLSPGCGFWFYSYQVCVLGREV